MKWSDIPSFTQSYKLTPLQSNIPSEVHLILFREIQRIIREEANLDVINKNIDQLERESRDFEKQRNAILSNFNNKVPPQSKEATALDMIEKGLTLIDKANVILKKFRDIKVAEVKYFEEENKRRLEFNANLKSLDLAGKKQFIDEETDIERQKYLKDINQNYSDEIKAISDQIDNEIEEINKRIKAMFLQTKDALKNEDAVKLNMERQKALQEEIKKLTQEKEDLILELNKNYEVKIQYFNSYMAKMIEDKQISVNDTIAANLAHYEKIEKMNYEEFRKLYLEEVDKIKQEMKQLKEDYKVLQVSHRKSNSDTPWLEGQNRVEEIFDKTFNEYQEFAKSQDYFKLDTNYYGYLLYFFQSQKLSHLTNLNTNPSQKLTLWNIVEDARKIMLQWRVDIEPDLDINYLEIIPRLKLFNQNEVVDYNIMFKNVKSNTALMELANWRVFVVIGDLCNKVNYPQFRSKFGVPLEEAFFKFDNTSEINDIEKVFKLNYMSIQEFNLRMIPRFYKVFNYILNNLEFGGIFTKREIVVVIIFVVMILNYHFRELKSNVSVEEKKKELLKEGEIQKLIVYVLMKIVSFQMIFSNYVSSNRKLESKKLYQFKLENIYNRKRMEADVNTLSNKEFIASGGNNTNNLFLGEPTSREQILAKLLQAKGRGGRRRYGRRRRRRRYGRGGTRMGGRFCQQWVFGPNANHSIRRRYIRLRKLWQLQDPTLTGERLERRWNDFLKKPVASRNAYLKQHGIPIRIHKHRRASGLVYGTGRGEEEEDDESDYESDMSESSYEGGAFESSEDDYSSSEDEYSDYSD